MTKNKIVKSWLFIALIIVYGVYHARIEISSDTTTTLPMSIDLIRGNILLNGWILGTNNFYFTEIVIYAIGLLMQIPGNVLINWLPGVAYAIWIVGMIYLMGYDEGFQKLDCKIKYLLIISIIVFLGLVPYSASYTLLNANSHNNLYAFLVIYLVLLFKFMSQKKIYIVWITILAILMSLSEGVTSMVLFAPMGCFCILFFIRTKEKKYGHIFLSIILSFLISKMALFFIESVDGFYTRGMPIKIANFSDWGNRIFEWWGEYKRLIGVHGLLLHNQNLNGVEWCYHLILTIVVLCFIFGLIYCTWNLLKLTQLETILYFVAVINIVACIVTDVPVFHRYLVPAWYFGTILSFLQIAKICSRSRKLSIKKGICWICLVGCMIVTYFRVEEISKVPNYGNEQKYIVGELEQRGYGNGYGSFWCASQVSYYSNYSISIYPILVRNSIRIYPYHELVKKDWYKERDKHFVILQRGQDDFVDKEILFRILGKPNDSFQSERYEVFFWNDDISQYLIPSEL